MASIPEGTGGGPHGGAGGNILTGLLSFDRLIGESLIRILYYVGLVIIVIAALVALLGGIAMAAYSPSAALTGILIAAAYLVAGTLFWRVTCELWLVLFGIHNRLAEVRDRLPPR